MSQVITCDNCEGVWEIPSKYDHCPICRVFCFVHKTRTQAVHHIYDCIQIKLYYPNELTDVSNCQSEDKA